MWPLHASIQQTHDIISILSPNMICIYKVVPKYIYMLQYIFIFQIAKTKDIVLCFPLWWKCHPSYLYPHMTIHGISSNLSFPCMYSLYKFLVSFCSNVLGYVSYFLFTRMEIFYNLLYVMMWKDWWFYI